MTWCGEPRRSFFGLPVLPNCLFVGWSRTGLMARDSMSLLVREIQTPMTQPCLHDQQLACLQAHQAARSLD